MSLMKSYWIRQNTQVTTFTVFKLLRENQLRPTSLGKQTKGEGGGGGSKINPPPPHPDKG